MSDQTEFTPLCDHQSSSKLHRFDPRCPESELALIVSTADTAALDWADQLDCDSVERNNSKKCWVNFLPSDLWWCFHVNKFCIHRQICLLPLALNNMHHYRNISYLLQWKSFRGAEDWSSCSRAAILSFHQQRAAVLFCCSCNNISWHWTETHSQNPVEILLVYSQEVTVVLSQDNGSSTGGVVDERQLPKVVSFMERADNTLRRTTCPLVNNNTLILMHRPIFMSILKAIPTFP